MAVAGREIRVQGRVQGVGFRPFVWHLAREAGLSGQVRNDGAGVLIDIWGEGAALETFLAGLRRDMPPLARIDDIQWEPLDGRPPRGGFQIAQSTYGTVEIGIAPDAATCNGCLAEIKDPQNRRYRYPFTNCTHCGPRFSITEAIPYDRGATTMRAFTMCAACRREYEDPSDRRFHAQPNACPTCGPRVWLEDQAGKVACADPLAEAARHLAAGRIVAIKGIGGVHLACDAMNAGAVAELRRRKRRVAKPLALMAKSLDQIRRFCLLSEDEARLLHSSAAPIVLLHSKPGAAPPGIAPGQSSIGMMLPYAPVHHLLLEGLDSPLVMTSGNPSDMPQATDNAAARSLLAGIADFWLLNDRDIANGQDDSVARLSLGTTSVIRRARGMAPARLRLPEAFREAPNVLAMGAEVKSTFCLVKDGQAFLSPHLGDLKTAESFAAYRTMIARLKDLFRCAPQVVAIDLHQDYLSSRWGRSLAKGLNCKLVHVQHHHAHLAACLAEHHVPPDNDRTVGIVLDGTGLGSDGTIWGGEVLVGGYGGFKRQAHLKPVPLPGGEQAIREPWRNLVAHLHDAFGPDWRRRVAGTTPDRRLAAKPLASLEKMIAAGVNSPPASSAGRVFDAVAAALGIAFDRQTYEGQAAMELEARAFPHVQARGGYPAEISKDAVLSWAPLWEALLGDLRAGSDPGLIAARFHTGFARALSEVACDAAGQAATNRIVLSGGVLQNGLLCHLLHQTLSDRGFDVLCHHLVPANDGGISLGQATIAALGYVPDV